MATTRIQEPRTKALALLARATVRVENATGVAFLNGDIRMIATAWHVVRNRQSSARVVDGRHSYSTPVIQFNEDTDVAVLADDPRLAAEPLLLLGSSQELAIADPVHIAGYPGGWPGVVPLMASGTLAGAHDELWVNVDATWGHSGGPVCVVHDETPFLAGIVLGLAGQTRQDLDRLVSQLTGAAKTLGEAASEGGGGFVVGTSIGEVEFGDVARISGAALAAVVHARRHPSAREGVNGAA